MTKPDLYSFNVDALKALHQDSTTAWIEPGGRLHVVPLFNHLSFFAEHSHFIPEITAFLKPFAADGHLQISRPHMAEAMDGIYAHGWGRVGTYGGDKIELDCATDYMNDLCRKAKAVARMLNRALICRVIAPTQKQKRKHRALPRDAVWSSLQEGFVGWLSPSGDIFETPRRAPFATFVDDPDRLPSLAQTFADAIREDECRQSDQFLEELDLDVDEHIPWHYFYERPYDPEGEELSTMTALVLSHGWGRLRVENAGTVVLEAEVLYLEDLTSTLEKVIALTGNSVDARTHEAVTSRVP